MYKREHHRVIDSLLKLFDPQLLRQCQCYFGGGTAIALLLDEYRESVDIDFICASQEGYRELRNIVNQQNLGVLLTAPVKYPRDVRLDRYGIRTFLEVDGTSVKVEIVREDRIDILMGEDYPSFPVTALSRIDMFAEKLLANADRGGDKSTMSRDMIDTAMMMQAWGLIPPESLSKARQAYGQSIDRSYSKSLAMINNPVHLGTCLDQMKMDQSLLTIIPEILAKYPI
ncbi:hypothetical protein AAKU55_005100 [Oxalobacteraceae bacterium GrIS 1.11]